MSDHDESKRIPKHLSDVLERLGFARPTPVQEGMREPMLAGKDVLALAPTGTGKTLGFGVPLMAGLINTPPKGRRGPGGARFVEPHERLRAIVISPTRELAQQVAGDLSSASRGSVLRVTAIFGKSPAAPQREAIRNGVDILVGTPGRLREFVDEGSLSLAGVSVVVIDEADRMADMGFLPQVEQLLSMVPTPRQVICLSATLPYLVESRVLALMRDPVRVEVGQRNVPINRSNFRCDVADSDKVALLIAILTASTKGSTAVYVRTRRRAGWVAEALKRHNITVSLLHGDRSQRSRNEALANFAQGRATTLVATDVAARGLHVPCIHRVVNYDVPLMPEDFVHRIGRAGHGGGSAESFTFVDELERQEWNRVCELVGEVIAPMELPDFSKYQKEGRKPRRKTPVVKPYFAPKPKRRSDTIRRDKKKRERSEPIAKSVRPGGGVRRPKA